MSINIAIDGPAGAGKSTIAKKAARELNSIYVDTGAMYRAIALHLIRNGIQADNEEKIAEACQDIQIEIRYEDEMQQVYLNGENVTSYLREEKVGSMTSSVSVYPSVRNKLLELQRTIAKQHDVIMDGRDITTYVLPDADVKIYLTASVEARTQRRFLELSEKGVKCCPDEIKKDIEERDYRDMNREFAPLKKAEDAVLLDTSEMTTEEVVSFVTGLAKEALAKKNKGME